MHATIPGPAYFRITPVSPCSAAFLGAEQHTVYCGSYRRQCVKPTVHSYIGYPQRVRQYSIWDLTNGTLEVGRPPVEWRGLPSLRRWGCPLSADGQPLSPMGLPSLGWRGRPLGVGGLGLGFSGLHFDAPVLACPDNSGDRPHAERSDAGGGVVGVGSGQGGVQYCVLCLFEGGQGEGYRHVGAVLGAVGSALGPGDVEACPGVL